MVASVPVTWNLNPQPAKGSRAGPGPPGATGRGSQPAGGQQPPDNNRMKPPQSPTSSHLGAVSALPSPSCTPAGPRPLKRPEGAVPALVSGRPGARCPFRRLSDPDQGAGIGNGPRSCGAALPHPPGGVTHPSARDKRPDRRGRRAPNNENHVGTVLPREPKWAGPSSPLITNQRQLLRSRTWPGLCDRVNFRSRYLN